MSKWTEDPLNQLVGFQKGRKVHTSPDELPGYAPYLGAGAISGGDDGYASTVLAVIANENDVLMLWDGERSGLVGHALEGVVSSTVCRLTPNNEIDSSLLYYLLSFNFEWIQNRRTGTGVPHVPKDIGRILRLRYPVEPAVQARIAHVLRTIDSTIEKTESLIEKYQQIKAGLMHDLFTRGIGADGKLRPPREQAPELYQHTPMGWIPKEWGFGLLNDVVNQARPIVYGILMPGYGYEGGVPVVKVKDINDRKIDTKNLLLTSPAIDQEYRRSKLRAGDVLVTIRGSVGRVCIVPEELEGANITQDTARIDISTGSGTFFSYYLETHAATKHFAVNTLGVAVQGINLGELRKTPILMPPVGEQEKIAQLVDSILQKIEKESESLKKLRQQKAGLMTDLLTNKRPIKVAQSAESSVETHV